MIIIQQRLLSATQQQYAPALKNSVAMIETLEWCIFLMKGWPQWRRPRWSQDCRSVCKWM
jgi:hypothetical protein